MKWRGKILWGIAYVALIVGVVWGMQVTRAKTIASLSTPQAQADWQAWREAAAKQSEAGPVRRRVPKGDVPPALTLMRDYYPTLLTAGVFFSSVLFILFAWAVQNAFRKAPAYTIAEKSSTSSH
jgi:hypothetical protein